MPIAKSYFTCSITFVRKVQFLVCMSNQLKYVPLAQLFSVNRFKIIFKHFRVCFTQRFDQYLYSDIIDELLVIRRKSNAIVSSSFVHYSKTMEFPSVAINKFKSAQGTMYGYM